MLHRLLNRLNYLMYSIKIGVYSINNKRFDFAALCKNKLVVQEKELSYFTLSANTITIINKDNEQLFFREVLRHEAKPKYFKYSVDRFLKLSVQGVAKINFEKEFPIKTRFKQSYVDEFASWLHERFLSPKDYKMLSKSDYVLRRQKFSIWNEDGINIDKQSLTELNLQGLLDSFYEIAPLFLSYIGGCAYCYRVNRFNHYETYYAQKSIASYLVASRLGKSLLVTEAIPTELITENGNVYGVLSPRAPGTRAQDSNVEPTAYNQRDLSSLWLLDVLCCQPDHAPNNYNVINNAKDGSICAFDNDNMFTFFPIFNIKRIKSSICSSLIDTQGYIKLPHLDKELCICIVNGSAKELSTYLDGLLNRLQKYAFRKRYKQLKKAISKTNKRKPNLLLDLDQWGPDTMDDELKDRDNLTYLGLLYKYVRTRRDSIQ